MITNTQLQNLKNLLDIMRLHTPRNFNQSNWKTCIGNFAADNNVGGLRISGGGGFFVYNDRGDRFSGNLPALDYVFGHTTVTDIFVNSDYFNCSFSEMKLILYDYIRKIEIEQENNPENVKDVSSIVRNKSYTDVANETDSKSVDLARLAQAIEAANEYTSIRTLVNQVVTIHNDRIDLEFDTTSHRQKISFYF